jgi:hypothetical protein
MIYDIQFAISVSSTKDHCGCIYRWRIRREETVYYVGCAGAFRVALNNTEGC